MLIETYGLCPNCEHDINTGSSFCPYCGIKLEWKSAIEYFGSIQPQNAMRYGTVNCSCGQSFYFETVRKKVNCIKCGKEHDVSNYPIKEERPTEEGDPDGTDI